MTKKIFKSFLILTVMLMFSFGIRVQAEETDVPETGGDITEYVDSGSMSINHWYSNTLFISGTAYYTIEYDDYNDGWFSSTPYISSLVIYGENYTTTYNYNEQFQCISSSKYGWSFVDHGTTYNVYIEVDQYGVVSISYYPYYQQ